MLKLLFLGNSVVLHTPAYRQLVIGQGKMASSCARGSSGWILGNISALEGYLRIQQAPWGSSAVATHGSAQNKWVWHFALRFSWHTGIRSKTGLDDLGGLFQP